MQGRELFKARRRTGETHDQKTTPAPSMQFNNAANGMSASSSNTDLKDSIPVEAPNHSDQGAINTLETAWQQQECSFAQMYQAITGTRIEDRKDNEGKTVGKKCGKVDGPGMACHHCQQTPPLFIPFEMTREIPISVVNESNIKQLELRSFPIPSGERLLIFRSIDEAKNSPWKEHENPAKTGYVATNARGDKAVCIQCCRTCHKAHLTPAKGVAPALFCNKVTKRPMATPETAALEMKKVLHPQRHGHPEPDCFIFGKDRFPLRVTLPDTALIKIDQQGKPILDSFNGYQYYAPAEIAVFFDDCMMPFRIVNNVVQIEMNQRPFERLYRPSEYDSLNLKIVIYLNNGKVPRPGLDLRYPPQQPIPYLLVGSPDQPTILYSSNLMVFMDERKANEYSDSDNEDEIRPKGVVAKRRYHLAQHLGLNMPFKEAEALFSLTQAYLRGGFLADEKMREQVRSARNNAFTGTFRLPIEGEDNRRKKLAFFNHMLNEVVTYYLQHCKHLVMFQEGLLQILDFYHGLMNRDGFISLLSNIRSLRVQAIAEVLKEDKAIVQEIQNKTSELAKLKLQQTHIENAAQQEMFQRAVTMEVICQLLASIPELRNAVYQKLPANLLRIPAERTCCFHFNRIIDGKVQLAVVTATPDNQLNETIYPNREAWEAEQAAKLKEGQIQEKEEGLSAELLDAFSGLSINRNSTAMDSLTSGSHSLQQLTTQPGDFKDGPPPSAHPSRNETQPGKRQRTGSSARGDGDSSLSLVPGDGSSREVASTGQALLGLNIPATQLNTQANGMGGQPPVARLTGNSSSSQTARPTPPEDEMDAGSDQQQLSERRNSFSGR